MENDLDKLIEVGEKLNLSIKMHERREAYHEHLLEIGQTEEQINAFYSELIVFRKEYQDWYSKSMAVIKLLLPDRLEDFTSH